MNRDEYEKSLSAKKDESSTQSSNYSKDFKVAMVSDEDYKSFEDHFLGGRRGNREDTLV